jgi:uncharacterized protein (TIGR02996 family)
MSDEADFLNAILANHKDNAPRLVYADWLEERGDPLAYPKAEYLRLTAGLLVARPGPRRFVIRMKLCEIAPRLDPAWLAVVSGLHVEACVSVVRFKCPKQWADLRPTDDPRVRRCDACQNTVHFCETVPEARSHATRGRCVALSLAVVRRPGDLTPSPGRFLPEELAILGRTGTPRTTVERGVLVTDDPSADHDRVARRSRRERLKRRRAKRFEVED